jgi:hypothetical protein
LYKYYRQCAENIRQYHDHDHPEPI